MSDKPIILYVDDEAINLQLFQINFKNSYTVIIADNGFKGLEILKQNKEIRIVVSDMKMPSMSGMEFIKRAKEMRPNIPYFLLTGYDVTSEIRDAINAKLINAHLKKPFDINEMEAVFSKALVQN